jgi:hypothetical protein
LVAVAVSTVAFVPLNFTVFSAATVLKPVPLMVTVVPEGPLSGEMEVMVREKGLGLLLSSLLLLQPIMMMANKITIERRVLIKKIKDESMPAKMPGKNKRVNTVMM